MRIEDYAKVLAARYEALEPEEKEAIRVLNQGPLLKKVFGPEIEPLTKRLNKPSAKGFAEGGVVYDPAAGKMKKPDFLGGDGGEEYRTFKNEAGMIMTIRFINGKPTAYIPPGYTEVTADAAAEATTPTPTTKAGDTAKPKPGEGDREGGEPNQFSRDLSEVSTEDIQDQLDGLKSGKGFNAALTGMISKSPFGMVVQALTGKSIVDKAIEDLQNEIDSRSAPVASASSAVSNAVQDAVESYGATQGYGNTLDTATDLATDMLGLSSAKGINANRDIAKAIADDMTAQAAAGRTFSSTSGRGYANPSSTSANLTGIMGLGTNQSQPNSVPGVTIGPMSGAMSAALQGHSMLGEYAGTPTAGDARGGYGNLAGDYSGFMGGMSDGPSGDFGGGDGGMSGAASAAAGGFGSSPGGEFGGAGGYGGGDVGTGSDNDGDGFGDMGGISGGWNKGGLVKKPTRKRKSKK